MFRGDVLLQQPEIPGGAYQLADDDTLSTNEVIRLIATALHRKPRLWKLPTRTCRGGGTRRRRIAPALNTERLRKLTENYVVDNQKIKAALRIQNFPIDAREGLLETIRSFG